MNACRVKRNESRRKKKLDYCEKKCEANMADAITMLLPSVVTVVTV